MTRTACLALCLASLGLGPSTAHAQAEKPEVTWAPAYSGNYSKGRRGPIEKIIIHTIEGDTRGAISLFQSKAPNRRKVSAHYIVSRDGTITQLVKDEDRAWHIKGENSNTIGIEHEGFAHRNTWTPAQYRASARLTRYLCDAYGIPPDRQHIRGHAEEPGQSHRRSDPGPHFKWDLYIDLIQGMAPVQVLSPAADQVLGKDKISPELTVRWLASDQQQSYRVQVAAPGGKRILYDSGVVVSRADRHTALVELQHGGRYVWRVLTQRQVDDVALDRESPWTPFSVDLVAPTVSVVYPPEGQVMNQPPVIVWKYAKPGAPMAGYRVRVTEGPGQSPVRVVVDTLELNGPTDRYQLPNRLEPGKTYHYRVLVHDGRGNVTLSQFRTFRTAPEGVFQPGPEPQPDPNDSAEATPAEMQGAQGNQNGLTDVLRPRVRPQGALGQ